MTHGGAEAPDLRRVAERAHDVEDGLPGLQLVEELRRLADALDDDGDVARFGVGVGDGERDALAVVVDPEDDELARAGASSRCEGPRCGRA